MSGVRILGCPWAILGRWATVRSAVSPVGLTFAHDKGLHVDSFLTGTCDTFLVSCRNWLLMMLTACNMVGQMHDDFCWLVFSGCKVQKI